MGDLYMMILSGRAGKGLHIELGLLGRLGLVIMMAFGFEKMYIWF